MTLKKLIDLKVGLAFMASLLVALSVVAQGTENQKEKPFPDKLGLYGPLDGEELFWDYCAVCHGADGKGGGPAASALKKPVPDLTLLSQRNGGQFPFLQVKEFIAGEREIPSAHGSREMPIWGPIFREIDEDRELGEFRLYNVTMYIKSLQQITIASQ